MQLEGDPVLVEDIVFDISMGESGVVTQVTGNSCIVQFANKRTMTYMDGGKFSGVKRLYWSDPIMMAPKKREPDWAYLRALLLDLRQRLRKD